MKKPTTKEAVDAVARHTGLDLPRVREVARALTDAGRLPMGGPGKAPELDDHHVVDIIIGSVLASPLRTVAGEVARYRDLTPGGADLTGAPASILTAGRALDLLASLAWANVSFSTVIVEIVSVPWREIGLIHDSGKIERFGVGTHWAASGHRTSTQISGVAFAQTFRDLFPREHSHV